MTTYWAEQPSNDASQPYEAAYALSAASEIEHNSAVLCDPVPKNRLARLLKLVSASLIPAHPHSSSLQHLSRQAV